MSAGWFDNASCLESPYKMIINEDNSFIQSKQGIVSLLSSDFNNSSSFNNNSIRRTLSAADMSSSQKWITPHSSPSSFKRVHSSLALGEHHHNNIVDDNTRGNYDHDNNNNNNNVGGQAFEEIWSSIQADKKSWGSILSPGKTDGSGSRSKSGSEPGHLPPPYVHPLAKRSSSLSEKSLEICTESLGSETGSDGFSYPASDPEDEHEQVEEEQEKEKEKEQEELEEKGNVIVEVGNYNYKCNNNSLRGPTIKRSMMVPLVRPSFPPPLPSLAHRDDGSNLHIRSHRQDGRLVVEAVAVPSQNCFRAQRQDGRLLLTLSTSTTTDEHELEQSKEILEAAIVENYDLEEEKEGGEEVLAIPRGMMNVQRSCTAFTMSKLMELSSRNKSTWPRKYNKTVIKTLDDNEEEIEDDELVVTRSLPPQPRVSASTATAAAVALNAYEYYWRRSNSPAAAAVAMLNPLVGHKNNNNKNCAPQVEKDDDTKRNNNKLLYAAHNRKGEALAQQEVVLLKAAGTGRGGATAAEKAEYLVPLMLRGCKEPKRSLLFWEPPCIATS
ncbi:protein FAF-like, chloroplastic [Chenopodium quinoa]|uniref:protein FAF-like, chloroplastic n=1 Tax=Chenopodium quinoa TaxID=63459 RepID=UPI000B785552|nr:protein FAF-like, chloroplastic [Chenopodium quinoa]